MSTKNLFYACLIGIMSCFFFTACENDDDKEKDSLIGTWQTTKSYVGISQNQNGPWEGEWETDETVRIKFDANTVIVYEYRNGKWHANTPKPYIYSEGKLTVGGETSDVKLTENTLEITGYDYEPDDSYYKYVVQYKRIE